MTKIAPDDILEGLYKLRIRESEKLKTVLELYDLEIHQKKLGPDYHRLKTMVMRSIEQDIRMRRTPWSRIREQNSVDKEFLEMVGNGKPTGSVWKETVAVSSTIYCFSTDEMTDQKENRFIWGRLELAKLKLTMEMNQVLTEQGDLLYEYLEQFFGARFLLDSITLLQVDRLQLTAVYCNRRGCVNTTPQMTFSRCKSVHKMAAGKKENLFLQ